MKWAKDEYHDGDGFAWVCRLPVGELVVDFADWIDPTRPWCVCWCLSGVDVEIGRAPTAKAGKALARLYVRRMADALVEALG